MVTQREGLHIQALEALHTLAACHERRGEHEQVLRYARRELELEPWDEEAHRQCMRALALSGRRDAALAQYKACSAALAEELGVEPQPETTALYERIRDGSDVDEISLVPPHNLPAQLTPLLGREYEYFLSQFASAEGKKGGDRRGHVLFIDARKLGSMVDRTHRELTDDDITRIANTYHAWRGEKLGLTEDEVAFYDALGAGRSIEEAYKFGLNAVMLAEFKESNIVLLKKRQQNLRLTTKPKKLLRHDEKLLLIKRFLEQTDAEITYDEAVNSFYINSIVGPLNSYTPFPVLFEESPTDSDITKLIEKSHSNRVGILIFQQSPDSLLA